MERYTVNRLSKRSNSNGLLSKWKRKYVGGFLSKRSWFTSGYDLNVSGMNRTTRRTYKELNP
ncbi:hypothetical protein O3G_MSEX005214 [Manduca sexta]|uniref:Uncharacterized protein n=1 Tax=Manduca sexta TaxID=7130 RepID=A0A921YXS1_MANSE|nr:hypothetical protein O3G_MSEX005214 [Manduca sexta]